MSILNSGSYYNVNPQYGYQLPVTGGAAQSYTPIDPRTGLPASLPVSQPDMFVPTSNNFSLPGTTPGYPLQASGFPIQQSGYPTSNNFLLPGATSGYPVQSTGFPTQQSGYPMQTGVPPAGYLNSSASSLGPMLQQIIGMLMQLLSQLQGGGRAADKTGTDAEGGTQGSRDQGGGNDGGGGGGGCQGKGGGGQFDMQGGPGGGSRGGFGGGGGRGGGGCGG